MSLRRFGLAVTLTGRTGVLVLHSNSTALVSFSGDTLGMG